MGLADPRGAEEDDILVLADEVKIEG